MKLAFISDLHLSENTFAKNQIFFGLMDKWKKEIDALYILGDFFDYWLGDDDSNVFIEEIASSFKNFGKPIYFIHGNHDFAIGKKFCKKTGVTLLKDCSTIKMSDKNILLSHGDVFCSLDIKYQRYKKIIRNPLLLGILKRIPLKWRHKIKDHLDHKSTQNFKRNDTKTYNIVEDSVAKIALFYNANIVIHGHTHNPGYYPINIDGKTIERFEIPDWCEHSPGGYILLDDNQLTIHYLQ